MSDTLIKVKQSRIKDYPTSYQMAKQTYVKDPDFKRDTVYDDKTYEEIITKYTGKTDLSGLLKLSANRPPVNGVTYVDLWWSMKNADGKRGLGQFTMFMKEGVPIRNIPRKGDPNDDRADNEGKRLAWAFGASKAGKFGQAMVLIGKAYQQDAERMIAEYKKAGKEATPAMAQVRSSDIIECVKTKYSKKHLEKPLEPLEDQMIPFKFDFGNFPDKHPYGTAGQPKFELYDARTKKPNVEGKSFASYQKATIERVQPDGSVAHEPINADNIHEFITRGSKVILQKSVMNGASASMFGLAMKHIVWKAVVLPGSANVPEDEREEEEGDNDTRPDEPGLSQLKISADEAAEDLGDDFI